MGSVIVPAHNESTVIRRTLEPLAHLARSGRIDLVVAANGCTDDTAEVARSIPGTRVLDLEEASKVGALNAADACTDRFPRMYLDADIEMQPSALLAVLECLETEDALAARPPFVYNTDGATWVVRAYFRARMRLPSNRSAMWGAGCYALSKAGRSRFGDFPSLIADDLYVDSLFDASEKRVVETGPVVVRAPRAAAALRAVLRRTYAGNAQMDGHVRAVGGQPVQTSNARDLVGSVRSLSTLFDAGVYAGFVLFARLEARHNHHHWSRDDSSRS